MRRTMHWAFFCFLALALALSMVMTGCNEPKSSEKDITEFLIDGVGVTILDNEIFLFAPSRIGLVRPVISYTGVSIEPESEAEINLFSDVVYKVTAEDGSTKTYMVILETGEDGAITIQMVPDGNNSIKVYGLPSLPTAGADIADLPTGLDFVLSRQLKQYDDVSKKFDGARYNDNLPNTLLISIGAPVDDAGYIYDSIKWTIDNKVYDGGPGNLNSGNSTNWVDRNIVYLDAKDYSYRIKHYITITAEKDDIEYTKTLYFAVVR